MTYRILSFDGGGIRGILTARLLVRLHRRVPQLFENIDLFAGTSTGALIALALAASDEPDPEDVEALYREHGRRIFASRGVVDDISPDELVRANYDNEEGLRQAVEGYFGPAMRLGELVKSVLVPTFRLDRRVDDRSGWAPKIYHNVPADGRGDAPDDDVSVVDVALMTTAAPTYFPSYSGAIDGGVFANNPSVCAISKAVNIGRDLGDVRMLAFGTGVLPRYVEGDRVDWGVGQWGLKMLSLVMSGMSGVGDYHCQQLLGDRYRRLDAELPEDIDLDQWQAIEELVEIAELVPIDPVVEWLTTEFL